MNEPQSQAFPCARFLLGVPLHDVAAVKAVNAMIACAQSGRTAYGIAAPARWWTQAWGNADLAGVYRGAGFVFPDTRWATVVSALFGPRISHGHVSALLGLQTAEAAAAAGVSVFLAGGTRGGLDAAAAALASRLPRLVIAGTGLLPGAAAGGDDGAALQAAVRASSAKLVLADLTCLRHALWLSRVFTAASDGGFGLGLVGGFAGFSGARRSFIESLPTRAVGRCAVAVSDNLRVTLAVARALLRLARARRTRGAQIGRQTGLSDAAALNGLQATLAELPPLADDADACACLAKLSAQARLGTLILDLRRCAWLDSREVGVLAALARACRQHGNALALCQVEPRVAALLEASRLAGELMIPETIDGLLADLRRRQKSQVCGVASVDGDTVRVVLPAELTVANLEAFRSSVAAVWGKSLRSAEVREMHVDAMHLSFLDSAAMGYLVHLRKIAAAAGVTIRYSGFKGVAQRSLKMARLERLFADE